MLNPWIMTKVYQQTKLYFRGLQVIDHLSSVLVCYILYGFDLKNNLIMAYEIWLVRLLQRLTFIVEFQFVLLYEWNLG